MLLLFSSSSPPSSCPTASLSKFAVVASSARLFFDRDEEDDGAEACLLGRTIEMAGRNVLAVELSVRDFAGEPGINWPSRGAEGSDEAVVAA